MRERSWAMSSLVRARRSRTTSRAMSRRRAMLPRSSKVSPGLDTSSCAPRTPSNFGRCSPSSSTSRGARGLPRTGHANEHPVEASADAHAALRRRVRSPRSRPRERTTVGDPRCVPRGPRRAVDSAVDRSNRRTHRDGGEEEVRTRRDDTVGPIHDHERCPRLGSTHWPWRARANSTRPTRR